MVGKSSKDRSDSENMSDQEEMSEMRSFQGNRYHQLGGYTSQRVSHFSKAMAVVNLVLGMILAFSLGIVAHKSKATCLQVASVYQPYSPALEAIVPTVKKFKPKLVYQSETSPEVEDAWKSILGPSDGLVAIDPEESAKLANTNHESTESVWEPGKHVYGISMFHQLHCLNTIRKSFYRDQFYPNVTDKKFLHHKNHCFDFLRQAIMCHGDVSMTYWWNKDYTVSLEDGREVHSEWFENMSIDDRATNSSTMWDVEHTCRLFEPIEAWVAKHAMMPNGYSFPEDQQQG